MLLLPLGECCTENIPGECLLRTAASMRPSNLRKLSQHVGNLSSSFRNVAVSLPELISEKMPEDRFPVGTVSLACFTFCDQRWC